MHSPPGPAPMMTILGLFIRPACNAVTESRHRVRPSRPCDRRVSGTIDTAGMATTRRTPIDELGTILSIWAHPDDETYLAAGVMAAAADRGQRVVCVSVTVGEHGTNDPARWPPARLGPVRRWEATAAMAVLGVGEHRFLDLPDGQLPAHDDLGPPLIGR